jgi:hypothetical protein
LPRKTNYFGRVLINEIDGMIYLVSINLSIFIQVNLFAQAVTQKQFPLLSLYLISKMKIKLWKISFGAPKSGKRDVGQYVCLLSVHMSLQKNSTEIHEKVENNL